MRVPGPSGSSHLGQLFFPKTKNNPEQQPRGRWYGLALALLLALVPAYAQQGTGGTAGAAAQAGRDMQPPAIAQMPVQALPQIAEPAPPLPVLASSPVVHVPPKDGAAHGDDKYNVSKIGERGIGGGFDFYSLEREQALGRELALEVEGSARLIKDPVIAEYVNRLGQRIVRNSDARVPFTIKVIDNEDVNAFALPGGYFYVNSGLILAADNEAELAGVMAHEIAHVAARHATKNATKMQILNIASIPMIFFGGPVGYAVRQLAGLAVPMSFLKFSRDAEREADLLGLEYEYACGYDPQEFVKFFEKLRLQDGKKHSFVARAFSTHPMTSDRIERAQKEIERYLPTREQYVVNTSEFDEVKAKLAELIAAQRVEAGKDAHPTLRKRREGGDTKGDDNGPTMRRKRPE